MNCWHCNSELIWQADFNGDDYCRKDIAIVTNLCCPKCESYTEVFLPKSTKTND